MHLYDEGVDKDAPLAPERDLLRVTAERLDVVLQPAQRESQVVQAEVDVALGAQLVRRHEAERRHAVVDRDEHLQTAEVGQLHVRRESEKEVL